MLTVSFEATTYAVLLDGKRIGAAIKNVGGWEAYPTGASCLGVFPKREDAAAALVNDRKRRKAVLWKDTL